MVTLRLIVLIVYVINDLYCIYRLVLLTSATLIQSSPTSLCPPPYATPITCTWPAASERQPERSPGFPTALHLRPSSNGTFQDTYHSSINRSIETEKGPQDGTLSSSNLFACTTWQHKWTLVHVWDECGTL